MGAHRFSYSVSSSESEFGTRSPRRRLDLERLGFALVEGMPPMSSSSQSSSLSLSLIGLCRSRRVAGCRTHGGHAQGAVRARAAMSCRCGNFAIRYRIRHTHNRPPASTILAPLSPSHPLSIVRSLRSLAHLSPILPLSLALYRCPSPILLHKVDPCAPANATRPPRCMTGI